MKCKYTEIPHYEETEILGKTVEAITGTVDRKKVGRVLLTTEAGFDGKHMVVGGDGVAIHTVQKIGEDEGDAKAPELFVELVGGIKSLASYKFFKGYTAKNPENADVVDVYTADRGQVDRVVATAHRMCDAHPECDSQWKVVDKDGNRVFIRMIAENLTATGKIDE